MMTDTDVNDTPSSPPRWQDPPPNTKRVSFRGKIVSLGPGNISGVVEFDENLDKSSRGMFRDISTKDLDKVADDLKVGKRVSGVAYVNGARTAEIIELKNSD
jgi:hypothetical protein